MKKTSRTALMAAGAAIVATPRAVAGKVRMDVSDPKTMIEQLNAAFAEFKETNNKLLESKADDVVLTDQHEEESAGREEDQDRRRVDAEVQALEELGERGAFLRANGEDAQD